VIKHSGHLWTLKKCRKHSSTARVFYISLVFSNARCVLSQCNTPFRLLYLLNISIIPNNALFKVAITVLLSISNYVLLILQWLTMHMVHFSISTPKSRFWVPNSPKQHYTTFMCTPYTGIYQLLINSNLHYITSRMSLHKASIVRHAWKLKTKWIYLLKFSITMGYSEFSHFSKRGDPVGWE